MLRSVFVLCLCLVSLAGHGADTVGRLAGKLEADFHTVMSDYDVPGAAFVMVKDGEIVRMGVRGVRKKGEAGRVDRTTVFPLASVSKTFAGTLAAMLVDDGLIALDTPVKPYLPQLVVRRNGHVDRLKVSHLLTHSTGLTPNAYDNLLDAGESLDVILPKFKRVKPICGPGRCYGYQNIFFSLIEPVIQKETGADYASLVEARLFDPLGMDHALMGYSALDAESNKASPHIWRRARGWQSRKHKPNYIEVVQPAAGVAASITDMAQWLKAHVGARPDVLTPEHLALIRTKHTRTTREKHRRFWKNHIKAAHYGLGWRLYNFDGENLVYHGGGIQGFRSSVAYSPDLGIGVAVLVNAESRAIDDLNTRFWHQAFQRVQTAEAKTGTASR